MRRNLTIQGLFIVFFVCLFSAIDFSALGQESARLQEMVNSFKLNQAARDARIEAYLNVNKSASRTLLLDDDRQAIIYDIVNGMPEYTITYNKGAAETLGTNQLYSGGNLGLSLTGNGIKIGVWDGGYARDTHQEYIGRILTGDGNEFGVSNHATHVMGTILASGVNPNAKGMAPEATGISFGFNNDLVEMSARALTASDYLILSNHSYGSLAGWNFNNNAWTWYGDASISEAEDWKFGFYNSAAKNWDELAHNAPYYTIVKSAGNDRSDSGNGTRPADGPYDIISTNGTAKNIITVGAIQKISGGYNGLNSVVMSSFSGWGPTDDGRIKPDIVGAGVSINSSVSSADDAYGNLQGTSMSAPNVTGSIALLQDLYSRLNGGEYMRSATVKSLIFHTANEAGPTGPDYVYGWGVMNTEGAARLLLNENNYSKVIRELSLNDGESYEILFTPKSNSTVKATIVWNDVPGTPPAVSLDPEDLMLVNDLDLRISDGTSTQLPWILDPSNPGGGATKGDNFRDNSEQVVFTTANASPLSLVVSHKGTLTGGSQRFSLVLSYEPANTQASNYYWIGKSGGSWTDVANWSTSSGGASVGSIPTASDVVFFDANSFNQTANKVINLGANQEIGTFMWLSEENVAVNMNGATLKVSGDLILSNQLVSITNGKIILGEGNSTEHRLVQNGVDLSGVDLTIDANTSKWDLLGGAKLGNVNLTSGGFAIVNSTVTLNNFSSNAITPVQLYLTGSTVNLKGIMDLTNEEISFSDSDSKITVPTGETSIFLANNIASSSSFKVDGNLTFGGLANNLSEVTVGAEARAIFFNDAQIKDLTLLAGADLTITSGKSLSVLENIVAVGEAQKLITIQNTDQVNSSIEINGHKVVCLAFLSISNVDLLGTAAVTVGVNSTLDNAGDWQSVTCENVLFSDFMVEYTCQNALTEFTDISNGSIDSWVWDFGDNTGSSEQNPVHQYTQPGLYNVTLTVNDVDITSTYTSEIQVIENTLNQNVIVNNDGVLASQQSATLFQWYKDGSKIDGATSRTYNSQNIEGTYFVVTFNGDCNLKSADFVLLVNAIDDEIALLERSTRLYPNPSNQEVEIDMINDYLGKVQIEILDIKGKSQLESQDFKNDQEFNRRFDISKFSKGIYLIKVSLGSEFVVQKKLIIN
jgi:subtilisin family serine protease